MKDTTHLLTSVQMANFAADGFLIFPEFIPAEINAECMREIDEKLIPSHYMKSGMPLSDLWPESKGFGTLFRLPQVQGVIRSLVGPEPRYDHHAFHKVGPQHADGQIWHADNILDTREHFDVQLFYFPHDTPREMGGTMFLPGSQFRRVHESNIGRYQNFQGQVPMVCKAGTLAVAHHGIWHCAQPNSTDAMRYMFKLRVNPTVRQKLLWNAEDVNSSEIGGILFRHHGWYGNDDRLEYCNRIRFWRFLTGDATYDAHYWLSRVENRPERVLPVGL